MGVRGTKIVWIVMLLVDESIPVLKIEYSLTFRDQAKAKASAKSFCFKGSLLRMK